MMFYEANKDSDSNGVFGTVLYVPNTEDATQQIEYIDLVHLSYTDILII